MCWQLYHFIFLCLYYVLDTVTTLTLDMVTKAKPLQAVESECVFVIF